MYVDYEKMEVKNKRIEKHIKRQFRRLITLVAEFFSNLAIDY